LGQKYTTVHLFNVFGRATGLKKQKHYLVYYSLQISQKTLPVLQQRVFRTSLVPLLLQRYYNVHNCTLTDTVQS